MIGELVSKMPGGFQAMNHFLRRNISEALRTMQARGRLAKVWADIPCFTPVRKSQARLWPPHDHSTFPFPQLPYFFLPASGLPRVVQSKESNHAASCLEMLQAVFTSELETLLHKLDNAELESEQGAKLNLSHCWSNVRHKCNAISKVRSPRLGRQHRVVCGRVQQPERLELGLQDRTEIAAICILAWRDSVWLCWKLIHFFFWSLCALAVTCVH